MMCVYYIQVFKSFNVSPLKQSTVEIDWDHTIGYRYFVWNL